MKKEYIFAGFGGQGMLLIGKFLAMACMLDGKHVSWLPSYGPEMRGGTANCSVIVSDDPVASPLVDMADCVVAMNRPSLDKFESHVKPGGVLVINSSIIDRKAERDDIQVVYCDANGIAESVGNPKGDPRRSDGEGSGRLQRDPRRSDPHRAWREEGQVPRGQHEGARGRRSRCKRLSLPITKKEPICGSVLFLLLVL